MKTLEPVSIAFGINGSRIYLRVPFMDEDGDWHVCSAVIDDQIALRLLIEIATCIKEVYCHGNIVSATQDDSK